MDSAEGCEKLRETIVAIHKVFRNKRWRTWADAWLAGTDRTSKSAIATATAIARLSPRIISYRSRIPAELLTTSELAYTIATAAGLFADYYEHRQATAPLPEFAADIISETHKNCSILGGS
jgi:hypothetical protein